MVVFMLAFMAFQAVCATQENRVDSCEVSLLGNGVFLWSQPYSTLFSRGRDISVKLGDGQRFCVSSLQGRELMQIYKDAEPTQGYRLGCYLPYRFHRMNGDIFSFFINPPDGESLCGSVGYQNESFSTGCLIVKQPYLDARTERFSLVGATDTTDADIFCVYDFHKDRVFVTRFLEQYSDQSQFFVRIEIPYVSVQQVLVTWGKSVNGVETPSESPVLFDFTHSARS